MAEDEIEVEVDDDDKLPPKMMSYTSALYHRMDAEATQEGNTLVWRGRVTATCRELGIPDGTRSRIINKLRAMGCVEQLTRGHRGAALATFILHYPPTVEKFEDLGNRDLTYSPTPDILARAIEDLRRQMGGINFVSAFANIEHRLSKIESQLNRKSSN